VEIGSREEDEKDNAVGAVADLVTPPRATVSRTLLPLPGRPGTTVV